MKYKMNISELAKAITDYYVSNGRLDHGKYLVGIEQCQDGGVRGEIMPVDQSGGKENCSE